MSEQPPDEPGDGWSDVIKKVEIALDDANIDGEAIRQSLIRGVRQALGSLESVLEGELVPDEEAPEVVVMEGGRSDDQPTTEGEPPDLRLADDDAEEGDTDSPPGPTGVKTPVSTTVRVFRTGIGSPTGTGALGGSPGLAEAGRIRIEEGAADSGQTLYRGEGHRIYRLHCELGRMRVLVEGQPIETILPGQSMDVETRLLRVLSEDGGGLQGRFVWISE
jgi:hypothetical protein